jgi:hypothetical protein
MEPGGLGGKPSPEEAVVASLISNIPPKIALAVII